MNLTNHQNILFLNKVYVKKKDARHKFTFFLDTGRRVATARLPTFSNIPSIVRHETFQFRFVMYKIFIYVGGLKYLPSSHRISGNRKR